MRINNNNNKSFTFDHLLNFQQCTQIIIINAGNEN